MKRISILVWVVFGFLTIATPLFAASKEKVLHSFNDNGKDGNHPYAGLIFDAAGNLYGTTIVGGTYNSGTVFELVAKAGGGWTEKILYSFNPNGTDGVQPHAGLIFDASSNLYGTTWQGGAHDAGTVFELVAEAGGGWTEKILYSFNPNGTDGWQPSAGLVFDAAGNLYGTAAWGGAYGYGTVFELVAKAGGGWTEKILHDFGNGTDGAIPFASMILDGAGNIFGTTYGGGTYNVGTVFELTPKAGGGWKEKIVHSFDDNGKDGCQPVASMIFDASGNLYGTSWDCGAYYSGVVFELTPKAGGGWKEKIVHSFNDNGKDGNYPVGLILDASGNLYGVTYGGGAYGQGAAFELTPKAGGGWTEKILHSFNDNGKDGKNPYAGLIFDTAGNLYGTNYYGGTDGSGCSGYGCGVVFEVTP